MGMLLVIAAIAALMSGLAWAARARWRIAYLEGQLSVLQRQLDAFQSRAGLPVEHDSFGTIGSRPLPAVQQSRLIQSGGDLPPWLLSLDELRPQLRELALSADDRRILERVPNQFAATMTTFLADAETDPPFSFPIGWAMGEQGKPEVLAASFHGDSGDGVFAGHALVTGTTGAGKDTLIALWLGALALTNSDDDLRLLLITKKPEEADPWRGKAHLWRPPAVEDGEIAQAKDALEAEVARRGNLLGQAGVFSWEEYRAKGGRLPLLVVVVTELDALALAVGKKEFDEWLNVMLSRCRSTGIRFILAPNTASNKSTAWRSQIRLFVSGMQDGRNNDEPNLGLPPSEVEELGGLPPSKIPGPGVFTARIRRAVAILRAPHLSGNERRRVLSWLPAAAADSPALLPWIAPQPAAAAHAGAQPASTPDLDPRPEERTAAVGSTSRRELTLSDTQPTPYELTTNYGLSLADLRSDASVARRVWLAWQQIPPQQRSTRSLTEFVFDPGPELRAQGTRGYTPSRWDQVVKPILADFGVSLEDATAEIARPVIGPAAAATR